MPDLKKVVLNSDRRSAILAHAKKLIDCPEEQAAESDAHAKLFAGVMVALMDPALVADLNVLARYKAVGEVSRVQFPALPAVSAVPGGQPSQAEQAEVVFCFCPRDVRQPVRDRHSGCHQDTCDVKMTVPSRWVVNVYDSATDDNYTRNAGKLPVAMAAPLRDLVAVWVNARDAHNLARKTIMDALRTVVASARRLDQVADAFPPAADLYEKFGGLVDVTESARAALKGVKMRPAEDAPRGWAPPPPTVPLSTPEGS